MKGANYLITILIVNFNSAKFIEILLYSLEKLTNNSYRVIIKDNGSKEDDLYLLRHVTSKYSNVELIFGQQTIAGSWGHAEALTSLVPLVNTQFFLVTDPDIVVLKKGWDETFISMMTKAVKVIGTQEYGGNRPGDFPIVHFALFETDAFRRIGASFFPKIDNRGNVVRENGFILDTGYQIRSCFLASGYIGAMLKNRLTRNWKFGPYSKFPCSEFYLEDAKEIICCHFARGSSPLHAKYRGVIKSIPLFGPILIGLVFRNMKNNWIKKSRELIDQQL